MTKGLSKVIIVVLILLLASAIGVTYFSLKKWNLPFKTTTTTTSILTTNQQTTSIATTVPTTISNMTTTSPLTTITGTTAASTTTAISTTTTVMATTTVDYVGPIYVEVLTDSGSYFPDDLVTIFGNVMDSYGNPVKGKYVSIEVKIGENTIFSDTQTTSDDGSYTTSFRLDTSAEKGTYTVYAKCIEPQEFQTIFDVI